MKTQAQIVERIKSTKNQDVHGTALLFQFLERAGQIEIMGKQITAEIGLRSDGFHEPATVKDVGPMLVDLIAQARDWSPVGANEENNRVQAIRKARIKALTWLVDDEEFFFDWTRTLRDLLAEIEQRYFASAT